MLAAIFAHYVPRAGRIGQAADSYSCRDQGKTRGESARVLSQTIRGQSSGISIPAFTMNRVGQGANPCQVSLGNTKWAQEILRPVSAMSQPETITTIQQHNTFTSPATDPELGNGIDREAARPRRLNPTTGRRQHGSKEAGGRRHDEDRQGQPAPPPPRPITPSSPQEQRYLPPPPTARPSCRGPPRPVAAAAEEQEEEQRRTGNPRRRRSARSALSSSQGTRSSSSRPKSTLLDSDHPPAAAPAPPPTIVTVVLN